MDNLHGRQIKGYEIEEHIGSGGFGSVYRARQSAVDREVAIKFILPQHASRPDFIRRFESEAQVVARLEHPHVIPLYDYWRDPDGAYLVMRWMRGGSLKDAIKGGPFELEPASQLIDQIASALDRAHRSHIIHRDVKPGNILLDEDEHAYIGDFGIAKDVGLSEEITEADRMVGSPDYLAPEQALSVPVTPATDIYSLGVTLYEMLAGDHPFPNMTAVERMYKHLNEPIPEMRNLPSDVQADVNDVIQKATMKDPQLRYQTVLDLAGAFRKATGMESVSGGSIVERLTRREQEILSLLMDGLPNREIAGKLFITVGTVRWYLRQIYSKLGVRSRVQAVVRARELDLIVDTRDTGMGDAAFTAGITYLPEPDNPYKGLRAFQSADTKDFYGREKITSRLLNRMQEDVPYRRFLSVVGPSGSGKSSLVKAGVIPALWRGGLPGSDKWFVVEMIPGTHPLDELEVALTRVAADQSANLHDHLVRDMRGLVRIGQLVLPDDDTELVIVIDQFEEVFTLVEDEASRQYFLDLLYTAVTDTRSRVRVIVTLRADFYDRPLRYPDFGQLVQERTQTILPLTAEELELAITRPARGQQVVFEDGLVATIVSDVNYQPGALPLLQYALTELFEQREDRMLTREAYETLGGTIGALAKRAEDVYLSLSPEAQALVQQIFLRLVTLGEGVEDTRRRVLRSELLALTDDVDLMEESIDQFAAYRLLSLDHDPKTRQPIVEVAHEALLREWDRLREWLNNSREDIRQERALSRLTDEWDQHARDNSFLLVGTRLDQVKTWQASTDIILTQLEQEYIAASIHYRAEQDALEVERAQKEQALESRAQTARRALMIAMGIATVVAAVLSVFALTQSKNARRSAAEFRSIAMATGARQESEDGFPDRAFALALEANNLTNPPTLSQQVLFEAVSATWIRQRYIGHELPVSGVTYSEDGQRLISLGFDGTVIIWDVATGQALQSRSFETGQGWDVKVQPGSDLIAFGTSDGRIMLWNPTTDELRDIQVNDTTVESLTFSPDGTQILATGWSNLPTLWDVESSELIQSFVGHEGGLVGRPDFSPDGTRIVTGGLDETVRIWDVATGENLTTFKVPDEGPIPEDRSVAVVRFLPDGRRVISGDSSAQIILWDTETREVLRSFEGIRAPITTIDISPDGRQFIFGTASNEIYSNLYDIESGRILRTYRGHTIVIPTVAFSPDGKTFASASGDGTLALWDVTVPGVLYEWPFSNMDSGMGGSALAVNPADDTYLESTFNGILRMHDLTTGDVLYEIDNNGRISLELAFSPDGRYFTSGEYLPTEAFEDHNAYLWDAQTGERLHTFDDLIGPIGGMAFSPDSRTVAIGEWAGTRIKLYDVQTFEELLTLEGHSNWVQAVVFSPDGQRLYSAGRDVTIREWDVNTGEMLRVLEGHTSRIRGLDISPDGRYLISASDDHTLKLWDIETGEAIRTFVGHDSNAFRAFFSPDGQTVVSGSDDRTLILWDVETGQPIWRMAGHSPNILDRIIADFSPDGQTIISVSEDAEIIAWDVSQLPDDYVAWALSNRYIPDFSCEERELYDIEPLCEADE